MHPHSAPSVVGEVLGSYRVVAELSRGGMGAVYRAEHELLGRPAAIKLLRPELSKNDDLVARFFQEAKAATAIRHPGIVEVYDFGHTDDGRAYLVMELLEGETLASRATRLGKVAEGEAARIVASIASALKAAHAKGIIHRDLKPDNVFLVPDADGGDRIKVLDFGIAKLTDVTGDGPRRTQTGVLMGTPLYMAPEQARAAGEIDHRADLYSLGCILYELVVGRPPFVAEGAGEIIAMHLMDETVPPTARGAKISPAMEATILRLLEKEPDARFETADAVQAALTRLATGATATATSSAPRARAAVSATARTVVPTPLPGPALALRVSPIDRVSGPAPRSSSAIYVGLGLVVAGAIAALIALRGRGHDAPTPATAPVPRSVPTAITPPPAQPPIPTPGPAPAPVPVIVNAPPRAIEVVEDREPPAARPTRRRGAVPPPGSRAGSGRTYSPNGSPIEVDLGAELGSPRKPPGQP